MIDKIYGFFNWIVEYLSNALQWIYDLIRLIPQYSFSLLIDGAISFLNWIPVPDFVYMAAGFMQSIPPEVTWFLSVAKFNEGLLMVMGAYILRFITRRIPLIG